MRTDMLWRGAVAAVLGLGLLPFLGLTLFVHPFLDDYFNANVVAQFGLWGAQVHWYCTWTGRFVSTFLLTAANPLAWGLGAATLPGLRAAALLGLGLNLGALAAFFRAWWPVVGLAAPAPRGASWALAAAVLLLALNAMPEPFAYAYWYTGLMVYEVPWACGVGFAACALQAGRRAGQAGAGGWAAGAALCLVVGGGGNEIVLLFALVGLAALGWWLWPRPAARPLWLLWAATAAGLVVMAATAPGNWQRAALTDPGAQSRRWLLLLPRTALSVGQIGLRPAVLAGVGLLALAGVALAQAGRPRAAAPPRGVTWAGVLFYGLLNLAGAGLLRLVWVEAPPNRVANVVVMTLLASTAALAVWAGPWVPRLPRPAQGRGLWLAALVATLALGQAGGAWPELLRLAPAYDHQMRDRYQRLQLARRRGQTDVALPPLHLPAGQGILAPQATAGGPPRDFTVELKPQATGKPNQALARYYGLRAVRLAASAPDSAVGPSR